MKSMRIPFTGIFIIFALLLFFIKSVHASTETVINFEGLSSTFISTGGDITPTGTVLTNQYMNEGVIFGLDGISAGVAVVEASGGYAPSSPVNSVAGVDAFGVLPGTLTGATVGDIYFSFVSPGTLIPSITDFVTFSIGDGYDDNDVFDIRAYNLADTMIYYKHYENISRFNVDPITNAGINRVEIDFTGSFGYSMDDLTFNAPAVAPEPVSSTLFIAGAVTLGVRRFRNQRKLS